MEKEKGIRTKTKRVVSSHLGEILLRNNRIYLVMNGYWQKLEIDVTPVWHFFKEVMKNKKTSVITERS